MSKSRLQQLTASLVIAALMVTSLVSLISAAPVTDSVRSSEITGTIPGGEFKEIWLDLEVMQPGIVTVLATWTSGSVDGVGFFILDEQDVATVSSGGKARDNNLAVGNPMASFEGAANQQEASFRATAPMYKLIIFNESPNDAEFDIGADNAYILGTSEYVSDPNAATDEGEAEATDEAAAESTSDTDEPDSAVTAEAEATPTPAEETEAEAETTPTATETPTTTTSASGVVSAETLEGALPEKDDQHFLGVKPQEKDGKVVLSLTYEPQDAQELERRINFWVLDANGFNEFLEGATLSAVAIAAGSPNVDSAPNERIAEFKVVGLSDYTVIVYNSSNVSATYALAAENAILIDDSGQTITAQEAVAAQSEAADDVESDDADAAAEDAATGDETATTSTGSSVSSEPGETYNNIDDCDVVEVGDVIELPPASELGTGATVSTTTRVAVAKPITTSSAVTGTTAISGTSSITGTTAVTGTTGVTGTKTMSETAATLVGALAADGRFQTLIAALDAGDLVDALEAEGPFTVFAPTDAAFAALPTGALDQLVAQLQTNPEGQLKQILLYHVSAGELGSADFNDGLEIQTLQGNTAALAVDEEGNVTINGAAVTVDDILSENGVAHAISAVILPPVE